MNNITSIWTNIQYHFQNKVYDDKENVNVRLFVLDPLSVIVKLAILGYKPVGTKVLIRNNVMYLQEPGMFQSFCRMVYATNKSDLQYLYNPIQLACQYYLGKEYVGDERMVTLFVCAKRGIEVLAETYKNCSMVILVLNYYGTMIKNYVDKVYNPVIFNRDGMTPFYGGELVEELNARWKQERVKVVLDIVGFILGGNGDANNVKSLENIMDNVDKETGCIIR